MATIRLNALALRPAGTGVQTYIREFLGALRQTTSARLIAVVQSDASGCLPPGVEAVEKPVASGARRALHSLLDNGRDGDVVHGLDVDLPLRPRCPTVATVHDLLVFDVPWTTSRRRAIGERALVRRVLRRADALVADSSFTAERIAAISGRTAHVVLLGPPTDLLPPDAPAVEAVRRKHQLPERFVLAVGTVEPRKGLDLLARACSAAGVPLVLAGAAPAGARAPHGAFMLGYVHRSELAALYGAATLVGYPSSYEGFGLPPLEAMACRAPVIASASSSLPEVLGDGAELVPRELDRWTDAIQALLRDPERRRELADRGFAWVGGRSGLSWARTATETLDVYRSVGVSLPPTTHL